MNQNRKGKSMLASVMGSTYPFGMVQALSKQQPSHVIIDEWYYLGMDFAGGSEPRMIDTLGTDIGCEERRMMQEAKLNSLLETDYLDAERRLFADPRNAAEYLKRFDSHFIDGHIIEPKTYNANRLRDKRGLDKWIRTAEAYGFRGELPERYAHEAERRQIARREWEWLASQRETRPAPEVD